MYDLKFLRGDSSRISTSVTPFAAGSVYLTEDDGGFYIDSSEERIHINPKSEDSTATLTADGWSGSQQTLAFADITSTSNGVIGISQSATDAQLEAAQDAGLFIVGQANGFITIAASGTVPTVDIPVVLILIP